MVALLVPLVCGTGDMLRSDMAKDGASGSQWFWHLLGIGKSDKAWSMQPDTYQEKVRKPSPAAAFDWPTKEEPELLRRTLRDAIQQLKAPTAGKSVLTAALRSRLPERAVQTLGHLDFEIRKDAASVFGALLQLADVLGASEALAGHLRMQPALFARLLRLEGSDLSSCAVLQSCARSPEVAEALVELGALPALLQAVTEGGSAEVVLEAFAILRELLCGPAAEACAAQLADDATEFFALYHKLLQSEDYFVQRQGLSLLAQFLVHPAHMQVMLNYVGKERHLQLIMNLLRSASTSIALESFHVFKLFVANPHRPPRVRTILNRNCDRLVRLLRSLASTQPQDEGLQADVAAVVQGLLASASEQVGN